jgi:hypothetical protein
LRVANLLAGCASQFEEIPRAIGIPFRANQTFDTSSCWGRLDSLLYFNDRSVSPIATATLSERIRAFESIPVIVDCRSIRGGYTIEIRLLQSHEFRNHDVIEAVCTENRDARRHINYRFVSRITKNTAVCPDDDTIAGMNCGFFFRLNSRSLVRYCALRDEVILEEIETLDPHYFSRCRSVVIIAFPPTARVSSIEIRAFAGCPCLTTITIPPSVILIEFNCFSECFSLRTVLFSPDLRLTG